MEYYGNNDYRDYLAHFGIKGMHWGIRRFQPYSVTGARKGGKTGKEIGLAKRVGNRIGEGVKRAGARIKQKAYERTHKAEIKKAQKLEKEKEEIFKSGSAKKMMENKEKFTTEEIEQFMKRAQTETRLAELRQKQSEINFEKLDQVNEGTKKVVGYLQTANNLFQQGQSLYKNVNDVKDMATGEKKKKEKESIINSADPKKILENREKLSGEDMQKAYKRAQTEDLLRKMAGRGNDTNADESSGARGVRGERWGRRDNQEAERVSGTVEGTGSNSSARNAGRTSSSNRSNPIDVEWREVSDSSSGSSRNSGGLGGNNNPRLNPGADASPSGGSGPKTTPPSSGGSGNRLALPQGISQIARQAAKSSSTAEGIKLTLESNGQSSSSKTIKETAKRFSDVLKEQNSTISANKEKINAGENYFNEMMKNRK